MKKLILIAFMAICSSGVFAAKKSFKKKSLIEEKTYTMTFNCGTQVTFKRSFIDAQISAGTWSSYILGVQDRACGKLHSEFLT